VHCRSKPQKAAVEIEASRYSDSRLEDLSYSSLIQWPRTGYFEGLKPDAALLREALASYTSPQASTVAEQVFGTQARQQRISLKHLATLQQDTERRCSTVWREKMPDFTTGKIEHVRQICRRLRPVLGEKMDGIHGAYLAEDTDGRSQIEHYLELLAARHIPQKLGQDDTELIPPSQAEASGEYPLGWVHYADKDLYEFGLRENEWIQHMAVVGRSG